MPRVVVTGMGCVSGLGAGVTANWQASLAGKSGIASIEMSAPGAPEMTYQGLAAIVQDAFEADLQARFGRRAIANVDRQANLAALATAEALDQAGLVIGTEALRHAAVVYGAAGGGCSAIEAGYDRLFLQRQTSVHPLTIPRSMTSGGVAHLSMLFGIRGLCFAMSSACSSSAHAVGEAMHLIRAGRAEIVVTGGADAGVTYGCLQAWDALGALSDDGCRPFSKGRSGTVLGEGAATLILESEESARRRGAPIIAEVAGAGSTSDAAHITQPDTESAAACVTAAFHDAGLDCDVPVLISAHGTGTHLNDRSEAAALRLAQGPALERSLVIATKSAHGHMLGATGAMEFLLAILALTRGEAPPLLGYHEADPECDLPLALHRREIAYQAAVSTSFAFGGLNCTLVARRWDDGAA